MNPQQLDRERRLKEGEAPTTCTDIINDKEILLEYLSRMVAAGAELPDLQTQYTADMLQNYVLTSCDMPASGAADMITANVHTHIYVYNKTIPLLKCA